MRSHRLLAALAVCMTIAGATAVQADVYPSRAVHLIVGFAAGSSADIVARILAQSLTQRLGQPFVVENRPGASTNIATETVVRAPPDGYTLLMVVPPNVINPTLYDRLSFNFIRDIAPVAGIARNPFVMEVNPSVPAKTVPEFIAYAKANPGKVTMGSGGNGSAAHMTGELFNMMAGVNLLHVPYHGDGPALVDLIADQVQVMFGTITSSIAQIRAGKLRALAVTTRTRSDALPDVPTLAETVPGYEAIGFNGIGAPKATPVAIVDKLNKEINAALADDTTKARLADLGLTVLGGSPADFQTLIATETDKWAKVIRFANLKTE
jgi:tripartite-type tricarboxylate transporter receptor subunit TctC